MRAALVSFLLALGIIVASPAPAALAHAEFILSTPDDGAQLANVPDVVELAFSEDLLPETVVVSVEDSVGLVVRVLEVEVDGADVIMTWPPGLTGPDYSVNYRVVSQDGHPVSGSVGFSVDAQPSGAAQADPGSVPASPAPGTTAPAQSTTGSPDSSSSSAAPVAAIAAGLAVGIAAGFLYLIRRRRGSTSGSDVDDGS